MNILASIINLFLDPSDAFQSLQKQDTAKTRTILLIILVFLGVISLVTLKDLTMEYQYDQTINRIESNDRIPEEQKEELLQKVDEGFENPGTGQIIMMWLTSALSVPVRVVFMAFIVMIIGNFIFGGDQKFGVLLNMTALTYMVVVLELIVKIPLMLYKWSLEVYTGLGLLGIGEPGTFLFHFLNGFDLFGAWRIILLGIGAGLLYEKKPGGFITALSIYWIIQLSITAGIGAAFS